MEKTHQAAIQILTGHLRDVDCEQKPEDIKADLHNLSDQLYNLTLACDRQHVEQAMESIIFDFDKDQLQKLDYAFGVMHELLPRYFKSCKMASVQSINSKKLSNFS